MRNKKIAKILSVGLSLSLFNNIPVFAEPGQNEDAFRKNLCAIGSQIIDKVGGVDVISKGIVWLGGSAIAGTFFAPIVKNIVPCVNTIRDWGGRLCNILAREFDVSRKK